VSSGGARVRGKLASWFPLARRSWAQASRTSWLKSGRFVVNLDVYSYNSS